MVMLAPLVANTGIIVAEFVGIAQSSEIFSIPRYFLVSLSVMFILWIVVKGKSMRVEKVFLILLIMSQFFSLI